MTAANEDHRGSRFKRAIRYVRTEPGLLRNVIAITVVVVLGLGIGGTVLSQQRFTPPWEQTRYVWATFGNAASVAPGLGQNVQINGVQVGQIADAQIDNKGRAQLLLTIRKADFDRPVYQNATVVMRPTTPLNTMYVELNPGSPQTPEMPDYGVLPLNASTSPIQIDQPLAQLDQNTREATRALLSSADVALAKAPRDLPTFASSTAGAVQRLQPIVAQLDVRREKVKQLVTSLGQLSQAVGGDDRRLATLANSLQTTLAAVSSQNDALRSSFNQLPGVVNSLKTSTGSVQGLSDQLDPTLDNVREASETLPDSLSGLTNTVGTLDTTVDKLRPVANKLKPTAADLRPFVNDLNRTLPDLKTIVSQLNPVTERLVPYLPDLTSFVYQTRSITDLGDTRQRNSLRALVQGGICSVPPGTELPFPLPPAVLPGNPLCNSGAPFVKPKPPKYDTFQANNNKWGDHDKWGDKKDGKKGGGN